MNKFMKVGLALAAGAAVAFASGCEQMASHSPAYTCGKVDYKSMASCKGARCRGHHSCKNRTYQQQQQQQ